jgi:3-phenylpropionate/cinnamic acid dioxygenase small subunit
VTFNTGETMRGLNALLTGALLGSFAVVGAVHAQGHDTSRSLPGAELAEIQQLYARYAQGTDFGNADMWLNVFTEDAVFRIGEKEQYVGRAQMTEWRRQSFARRGATYNYRHWTGSWVISPTPDGGATGRVYWMAFDPTAKVLAVVDTGYYDDIYVKTPSGWRIQQRHAHPDPRTSEGGRSRP